MWTKQVVSILKENKLRGEINRDKSGTTEAASNVNIYNRGGQLEAGPSHNINGVFNSCKNNEIVDQSLFNTRSGIDGNDTMLSDQQKNSVEYNKGQYITQLGKSRKVQWNMTDKSLINRDVGYVEGDQSPSSSFIKDSELKACR